jgi:hypothetical protein
MTKPFYRTFFPKKMSVLQTAAVNSYSKLKPIIISLLPSVFSNFPARFRLILLEATALRQIFPGYGEPLTNEQFDVSIWP